jgi:hypothetical protein
MAKKARTTKITPDARISALETIVARQSELLADTSQAIFELELSLKALGDGFYRMDYDHVGCMIPTFARAAASIQERIDMHLAYLPSTEAADDK